jgi:hypothetical protein
MFSYIESIDSNPTTSKCFKISNSITWPTVNLFNRVRNISLKEKLAKNLKLKSTRKFQTDDEISMKRFSNNLSNVNNGASNNNTNLETSMASSASYNSLNSITTIISNDNILNLNQTRLTENKRLRVQRQLSHQPNIILNYSLYLNQKNKSLIIDIISLENVQMPTSLSTTNNLELNIYVKIEILPPKEVTMMSLHQQIVSTSNTSNNQSSFIPKISAKTRLIRNRPNPIYHETFELENLAFIYDQLLSHEYPADEDLNLFKCYRLVFNVCNSNLFGRDQIIGQTVHNLLREDCFLTNEYKKVIDSSSLSHQNRIQTQNVLDMGKATGEFNSFGRIYSKKVDLVVDSRVRQILSILFY